MSRRVSPAPVVVRRARNGLGLFAGRAYRPGETIIRIAGRIVDAGVLWERGGTFADNCIRFGPETYLDPGDAPGRYVNHSCDPNAGIRKHNNQLFLFAARALKPRVEITFDYSTTIGDDDIWTMRCNCGRSACRKRVRRFGSLPADVQQRYRSGGLVPPYIVKTLGWTP